MIDKKQLDQICETLESLPDELFEEARIDKKNGFPEAAATHKQRAEALLLLLGFVKKLKGALSINHKD